MISPICQVHFATLPTSQLINTSLLNLFCQVVKSTSPSCKGHFIIWISKYALSCPNFEILQAFQCLKIYTLMCKILLGYQNTTQENRITYIIGFFPTCYLIQKHSILFFLSTILNVKGDLSKYLVKLFLNAYHNINVGFNSLT